MKLPEERIRIEMSKVMQLILIKIYPLNQMCVMNSKNSSRIFVSVGHETRFSLNQVIIRLTKIMNNLLKRFQFGFFSDLKVVQIFPNLLFFQKIEPLLLIMFLEILNFEILSKNLPNFCQL